MRIEYIALLYAKMDTVTGYLQNKIHTQQGSNHFRILRLHKLQLSWKEIAVDFNDNYHWYNM